jgi:hypothetical protein
LKKEVTNLEDEIEEAKVEIEAKELLLGGHNG